MEELRNIYALKAVTQIPRILSLEDRNPFSKTYGCFDRRFWLDKAADFPTALALDQNTTQGWCFRRVLPL